MFIAVIPLLIALIGLILYVVSTNGKVAEIGRIMFFCGLLVLTMMVSRETFRMGMISGANIFRLG